MLAAADESASSALSTLSCVLSSALYAAFADESAAASVLSPVIVSYLSHFLISDTSAPSFTSMGAFTFAL